MGLITPHEGRNIRARILLRREIFERDEFLELGLFTNVTGDENLTLAQITEPEGVGYERILIPDADWNIPSDTGTAPKQQFLAGNGGWTGIVQGYFVATRATGGSPRLLCYEFDNRQQLDTASLTRSGALVTVQTPLPHGLVTDRLVNVRGAVQPEYNGIFVVTITSPSAFTYTVAGTPASPATGPILVNRCFQMDVGSVYDVVPVVSFT